MSKSLPDLRAEAGQFCGRTNRREFIRHIGGGFASLALTGLLDADGFFSHRALAADEGAASPLAPKLPQIAPKAKSCIFLFMYGGPSHVDTFDYKPNLYPLDGKTIKVKTFGRGGHKSQGRVVGTEVELQAVRPVRQVGLRAVSASSHLRG